VSTSLEDPPRAARALHLAVQAVRGSAAHRPGSRGRSVGGKLVVAGLGGAGPDPPGRSAGRRPDTPARAAGAGPVSPRRSLDACSCSCRPAGARRPGAVASADGGAGPRRAPAWGGVEGLQRRGVRGRRCAGLHAGGLHSLVRTSPRSAERRRPQGRAHSQAQHRPHR
jgi:hypothetical protein